MIRGPRGLVFLVDNHTLRFVLEEFGVDTGQSLQDQIVARAERCFFLRHRIFSATLLIGLIIFRDHPMAVVIAATVAMGLSVLITTSLASACTIIIGVTSSLLFLAVIVSGLIGTYLFWDTGLWLWIAVAVLQGWFSAGSPILAIVGKLTLGFMVKFVAPIDLKEFIGHPPTYFLMAAVKNMSVNDFAKINLGADWTGVPEDDVLAAKFFLKAAEQGNSYAQRRLGHHYAEGLGVPKDDVAAYMWYNLAAFKDSYGAEDRDELSKTMTAEQIAEGQRLSREWKSTPFRK